MAAMAMLAQRGMSTPTNTRPPMDDGGFGSWTSGLPSFPSSGGGRSRGGVFGGFGGGSQRGGGGMVAPSSRGRGRGMGRR
jgi:hypothetical protein